MKKLFLITFLSMACYTMNAQGLYVRGGLGYAFSQSGQTTDGEGNPYNGSLTFSNGNQVYQMKSASFGAGFQGAVGVGYMFSRYIGVEVSGLFGLSPTKYSGNIDNDTISSIPSNVTITRQAKLPIIIIPALVLQTGGDKVNLYMRAGLALPAKSNITEQDALMTLPGAGAVETEVYTVQDKNSFGLGFAGAAGVQYNISDHTGIWLEANIVSMSLYIKEETVTDVTVDGQSGYGGTSYISTLTPDELVTHYSKNATYSATATPSQEPAYSVPFSSIGIHAGITYNFKQRKERDNGGRPKGIRKYE